LTDSAGPHAREALPPAHGAPTLRRGAGAPRPPASSTRRRSDSPPFGASHRRSPATSTIARPPPASGAMRASPTDPASATSSATGRSSSHPEANPLRSASSRRGRLRPMIPTSLGRSSYSGSSSSEADLSCAHGSAHPWGSLADDIGGGTGCERSRSWIPCSPPPRPPSLVLAVGLAPPRLFGPGCAP